MIVSSVKPSADHKALMVRLFNATDHPQRARLIWSTPAPPAVWISDLNEQAHSTIANHISLSPGES